MDVRENADLELASIERLRKSAQELNERSDAAQTRLEQVAAALGDTNVGLEVVLWRHPFDCISGDEFDRGMATEFVVHDGRRHDPGR